MLKRLLLFLKATWICETVVKISDGIVSANVVINHIIEQVDGSLVGDKIVDILKEVQKFLESVQGTVDVIREFTCGAPDTEEPVAASSMSVDTALENLKRITNDLNE